MLITLKAKIKKAFPCHTPCPSSFIRETERRFSARKKVHVSHLKLCEKGSNISFYAWVMPYTNPITDSGNALVTGKDPNTAYTNGSDVDMVIETDIQFFQNIILFSFFRMKFYGSYIFIFMNFVLHESFESFWLEVLNFTFLNVNFTKLYFQVMFVTAVFLLVLLKFKFAFKVERKYM